MQDIVARIRARFPRPVHAEDGLLANEAADQLEEKTAYAGEMEDALHDMSLRLAEMSRLRDEKAAGVAALRAWIEELGKE